MFNVWLQPFGLYLSVLATQSPQSIPELIYCDSCSDEAMIHSYKESFLVRGCLAVKLHQKFTQTTFNTSKVMYKTFYATATISATSTIEDQAPGEKRVGESYKLLLAFT